MAFFSGTTWGAGASSPVRRASAGSSGNGAGQIVRSAFFSQSCQRKGTLDPTLSEFDPAQHQTLSGLFDTTYEDVWKVLFKGAEAPASATEDRGFSSQRPADEVSDFVLYGTLVFHSLTLCGI